MAAAAAGPASQRAAIECLFFLLETTASAPLATLAAACARKISRDHLLLLSIAATINEGQGLSGGPPDSLPGPL